MGDFSEENNSSEHHNNSNKTRATKKTETHKGRVTPAKEAPDLSVAEILAVAHSFAPLPFDVPVPAAKAGASTKLGRRARKRRS